MPPQQRLDTSERGERQHQQETLLDISIREVDYHQQEEKDLRYDPKNKNTIKMPKQFALLEHWKGCNTFLKAQGQVLVVLLIAWAGNNFPKAYPRNDNHNMTMFWVMNALLAVAAIATLKHDKKSSSRGVQLLSRPQTEEWKGFMQFMFIMYHYYRAYLVYNEIRVFVSAYVWMTGFGNFLYFDKKKDFSIERAISMWLRINYFPLLLSWCLGVPLELYYVVPLHTTGFFITMATCYVAHLLQTRVFNNNKQAVMKSNIIAIGLCFLAHVLFYETPACNFLKLFSDEYYFRFQADKYSAFIGICSGFGWQWLKQYMQWCYANENPGLNQTLAAWGQRIGGVGLIALWYVLFGHITDKYTYNPLHPYVFWMPVAGWLAIRNSSRYLTELHSEALEFFGRITLETYVLQFHVFMCRDVQYIPIVIPGSGPDGHPGLKFANMLLCGVVFVSLAYWARQITVTTQETATELLHLLVRGPPELPANVADEEEGVSLTEATDGARKLDSKTSDITNNAGGKDSGGATNASGARMQDV